MPGEFVEQLSVVLVAPNIDPGSVDPTAITGLGEPVDAETVRTPVLTAARFPRHVVQIIAGRAQITATAPVVETAPAAIDAANVLVNDYIGRRSLVTAAHIIQIRRPLDGGRTVGEVMARLVSPDLVEALTGNTSLDVNVEIPMLVDGQPTGVVKVEPSRVGNLNAIFFAFSFQWPGPFDAGIPAVEASIARADDLVEGFLAVASARAVSA